jgi:uncharacterized protein involved in outer membrane biogenesis
MKFRKYVYLIIGIPLIAHVLVYLISIPYAKPYFERTFSRLLRSEFRVDKAEVFLLARSIHLTNPRLTMTGEGKDAELFRAHKAKIFLRLIPLIDKRLIVRNLVLHAPVLTVERSPAGRLNLREFFRKIDTATVGGAPGQPAAPAAPERTGVRTYLQKIYIKGGQILFTDSKPQPPLAVSLDDLKFFTVFSYDYDKKTLESIKFKINGSIRSDQPAALKIDGEIDPTPDYVGSTFRLNAYIDNFDITSIWPYIDEHLPLTLDAGRIMIESHLHCVGGTFEQSRQTVQIKTLAIRSWKEDFSADNTMGLSNKAIIKFIEKNCGSLTFDFYVSGSLKDLKVSPGELMLKMVGETLLNKATDTFKEQEGVN